MPLADGIGSGFSKAYDFGTKVTADITLYAKWIETADTVQEATQALTLETAFKFAKGDTWECITANFVMLGSAGNGAQITWTSSNTDVIRIEQGDGSVIGVITRPQNNDASVVIRATVAKDDDSVSKTFLLIIKRQSASKDETRKVTKRTAPVQAGENTKGQTETIYMTTLNDGTGIDYVMVTTDTVQALIAQGCEADHIVVTIDNDEYDPADEFAFEVSPDTVSALAQRGLGVTLNFPCGNRDAFHRCA